MDGGVYLYIYYSKPALARTINFRLSTKSGGLGSRGSIAKPMIIIALEDLYFFLMDLQNPPSLKLRPLMSHYKTWGSHVQTCMDEEDLDRLFLPRGIFFPLFLSLLLDDEACRISGT